MNAGSLIGFLIYFIVSLLMIGIGVSQRKSKTPVGFYSGEKPPDEKTLSDVSLWNKRHGTMWILYGIMLMLSYLTGVLIGEDSPWCLILLLGGAILPLIVMIWYHHRLLRLCQR